MQPDLRQIKALAELDDNRFATMLYTAAIAVGLSKEQAQTAAANAPAFKKMLQNASKEDLAMIQSKLKGSPADLLKNLGGADHE